MRYISISLMIGVGFIYLAGAYVNLSWSWPSVVDSVDRAASVWLAIVSAIFAMVILRAYD